MGWETALEMAEEKKRGGGPKTPEGKARSSQNALKHGGRSETLILPGEEQADFDKVAEGWRKEFEPEGYQEERLVEILVRNDWFFQRADRRWQEAEAEGADQHTLELMQRYRTTAERSFFRALGALRGLRKDLLREGNDRVKSEIRNIRLEADLKAKDALILRLQEEIKAYAEGKTVPKPVPSNQELKRRALHLRSGG